MSRRLGPPALFALLAAAFAHLARADDPPAAGTAVVTDGSGKEVKLAGVKVTAGTRRLGWLIDPKGTTDDAKKGPLALEVREPDSTAYQKGVVTLVPLASVESVKYEADKMTVAVKGLKDPLVGTTQFKGINVVALEGDAGGAVGKFSGGVAKGGFKAVTFAGAKLLPERKPGGTNWAVTVDHPKANNPTLTVRNLRALYSFPGGAEQLVRALPVRKDMPLMFDGTLKKFEPLAVDTNAKMAAAEVQVGDGPERLVAIPLTWDLDKRTGTLVGLLGEVDAGWKLFPLHTVKVVKPGDPPVVPAAGDKPAERWQLRHDPKEAKAYLDWLGSNGAGLLVPGKGEKAKPFFVPDPRKPDTRREATDADLKQAADRIQLRDADKESVKAVTAALGLDYTPESFAVVVSGPLEWELRRKERAYRGRPVDAIEKTFFLFKVIDGEPRLLVHDQASR